MAAEIARLNPKDAAALPRFMADNRAKLEAFGPILKSAFSGLSDLMKLEMLPALKWLRPTQSVDADLARYFEDERVRLTFSFQTKYLGMSPFRCPSLFTILSFLEYEYGVWHPIGGCGAVSEAMSEAAQTLGAQVRLHADVEGIAFEGRRAVGVKVGGEMEPADAVVVGADFAGTVPRLVPDGLRKRWTDAKIDKAKFSCSTVMLYLGLEGDYPHLDHHTIFLAEDYKTNIAQIEAGAGPPDQPSIYVQNPARTDDTFRTPEGVSLYVLAPVGNLKGGVDWEAERSAFRDRMLDMLEARGLTDLRARIRVERMLTTRRLAGRLRPLRGRDLQPRARSRPDADDAAPQPLRGRRRRLPRRRRHPSRLRPARHLRGRAHHRRPLDEGPRARPARHPRRADDAGGRRMRLRVRLAAIAAVGFAIGATSARAGDLAVTVDGVAPGGGAVYLALCQRGLTPGKCRRGDRKRADAGRIAFAFANLRPGTYAALAYQDANGNGRLDRTRLGLPEEPYAFSNGAGRRERPTWGRAAFPLRGDAEIDLTLRRFPLDEVPADERGRP